MSSLESSYDVVWDDFFEDITNKEKYVSLLNRAKLECDSKICPKEELVLRAFKEMSFNRMKVVLIGQDPYHTPGVADGLCFSIDPNTKRIPPSLNRIYKCLLEHNIIKEKPNNGNLINWAKSGVLMLNRYLTTREGTPKAHTFWESFTNDIIRFICKNKPTVKFILWGNDAKELKTKDIISSSDENINIECLMFSHPSPMCSIDFSRCNHFDLTKDLIDWRPVYELMIFTNKIGFIVLKKGNLVYNTSIIKEDTIDKMDVYLKNYTYQYTCTLYSEDDYKYDKELDTDHPDYLIWFGCNRLKEKFSS